MARRESRSRNSHNCIICTSSEKRKFSNSISKSSTFDAQMASIYFLKLTFDYELLSSDKISELMSAGEGENISNIVEFCDACFSLVSECWKMWEQIVKIQAQCKTLKGKVKEKFISNLNKSTHIPDHYKEIRDKVKIQERIKDQEDEALAFISMGENEPNFQIKLEIEENIEDSSCNMDIDDDVANNFCLELVNDNEGVVKTAKKDEADFDNKEEFPHPVEVAEEEDDDDEDDVNFSPEADNFSDSNSYSPPPTPEKKLKIKAKNSRTKRKQEEDNSAKIKGKIGRPRLPQELKKPKRRYTIYVKKERNYYICPICFFEQTDPQPYFSSTHNLVIHLKKGHTKESLVPKYICEDPSCNSEENSHKKGFLLLHWLQIHQEKEHGLTPPSPEIEISPKQLAQTTRTMKALSELTCPVCFKIFEFVNVMASHLSYVHSPKKTLICHICAVEFKRKQNLDRHVRSHETEDSRTPRFLCTQCPKGFVREKLLEMHLFYHSGDALRVCHICQLGFRQIFSFKRHNVTLHEQSGPRFDCHLCGKEFKVEEYLRQHLNSRSHGGQGSAWKPKINKTEKTERQQPGEEALNSID